ncbi:MAG: hypothetical protein H6907_03240 [Hyphomicrobiales bacterium]|nr:hypothetical protein [Hyphomicrobiales bacterium]MCP5370722.1 hypothetical protein [Hyphomicrobiales bacterium]
MVPGGLHRGPLARALSTGSQAVSYLLGGVVLVIALAAVATSSSAAEVAGWAGDVLGPAFVVLLGVLVLTVLYCWVRIAGHPVTAAEEDVWLETGVQAANGVTTLALTYTLLGISLGIGSLAGQDLTPETVQTIIRELTANFSLAFMTTVIGLPTSAVLRALLLITQARNRRRREGHERVRQAAEAPPVTSFAPAPLGQGSDR